MTENNELATGGLTRRHYLTLTAASGAALGLSTGSAGAEGHSREDVTIRSDEAVDPIDIAATVYRPAGATRAEPVPMILHSHGWAGSRTSSAGAFGRELDAGFGVLSFDQRGHGESGGRAHVEDPEREGRDVVAVVDYVADLPWVARSLPKGLPIPKQENPALFAMGGSYGGGYQFIGAYTETREKGYTRFDALAPEITWFDLTESLAPAAVPRTTWLTALYGAGAANVPQFVHEAFAYSAATGLWPNGDLPGEPDLESRFFEHGPSGFVDDGIQLDVPVLFRQGLSDNLFNFNQAWKNFERGLTDEARERSAVVGYNGGHALPNAFPTGTTSRANPSGPVSEFGDARLQFFQLVEADAGDARDVVGSRYLLANAAGDRAVAVDRVDDRTPLAGGVDLQVAPDGEGGLALEGASGDTGATTTGAGAPVHLPLGGGPLTVAGVPTLSASVTSAGVNQRVFAALSVGSSAATARVVQNNVMPLHEPEPVVGADRTVELPGVAVDVAEGEQLFLTLSAASDMFPLHGSTRTPGAVLLEDLSVGVPLTDA